LENEEKLGLARGQPAASWIAMDGGPASHNHIPYPTSLFFMPMHGEC